MSSSPAFGQADLTNCERELIHLAGSVQPHGLLLVLREPELRIIQASTSAAVWLRRSLDSLLMAHAHDLGGNFESRLRDLSCQSDLREPLSIRCTTAGDTQLLHFEGAVHRLGPGTLVAELEPTEPITATEVKPPTLMAQVGTAVQRISEAASIGALADAVVLGVRSMTAHDRVMVYEFDPDGHGKIIAEAKDARLDSLLDHRYPATDIPQQARQLYLRNRVRLLADVNYQPSELVPRQLPGHDDQPGGELDMSWCGLRSMSPLHLQYLRNMGVAATLVVSIVREGRLWGLIACHHDSPRYVGHRLRVACELLAEVMATRIAAIENHARSQIALQVRRLEQRLVEATSAEGDWRLALFRAPASLLQPVDATGAVLCHEGELMTCGEVPATADLRRLLAWVQTQPTHSHEPSVFATACLSRLNPELGALTPTASGILAIRLSRSRSDYLVWLRKEQLQPMIWAGNPAKPMVNNNPLELSPRRSFAAWSEIVRGTSLPWKSGELALAAAFGHALIDIIVQVNAVRLLIAENQLTRMRTNVADSDEAVVVADGARRAFYANEAFLRLVGRQREECTSLTDLVGLFDDPQAASLMLGQVQAEQRLWRGELRVRRVDGTIAPVALRAEPVPSRGGSALGYVFIFNDLTASKQALLARERLEASLARVNLGGEKGLDPHDVVAAIVANASLAAMDISDGGTAPSVAPQLQEVQTSTTRATALFNRIRRLENDAP